MQAQRGAVTPRLPSGYARLAGLLQQIAQGGHTKRGDTMLRFTRRNRLPIVLAALIGASIVLLTTAVPASADTVASIRTSGWIGPYRLSNAVCQDVPLVQVTQPFVAAVNTTSAVDGQYVYWTVDLF